MEKMDNPFRVRINDKDADFWMIPVGDRDKVGMPVQHYKPEYYGVKVLDTERLVPKYLYYVFEHMQQQGVFRRMAKGSTNIAYITVKDVRDVFLENTDWRTKP